jgi:hypothetical protein
VPWLTSTAAAGAEKLIMHILCLINPPWLFCAHFVAVWCDNRSDVLRIRAADIRLQKVYNFSLPAFLSHPPAPPTVAELSPGDDHAGKCFLHHIKRHGSSFIHAAAALVKQSLPFVIRGGASDWPACTKWTCAIRMPVECQLRAPFR